MSRITTSQNEAVDMPVQASDVNQSTNPNSDHNVNVDEGRDPTAANNAGNRDEFNVFSPLSENKSNATLPGDVSGGDPSSSLPGGETPPHPPRKMIRYYRHLLILMSTFNIASPNGSQ